MTWKELRDAIDQKVLESGLAADDIEVWYLDLESCFGRVSKLNIYISDRHHPKQFELWVD